jgi:hypothetical protein
MASKIQFKRGTTTQSNLYRGAEGEVIINTTKDTIVVHDGVQTGGYEIIRSDLSNISGNVPAVNITDVDCGIYGSGLFTLGAFSSALLHTLDNPNDFGTSFGDFFGHSVATSGNYAIVSSYNAAVASGNWAGVVYIFNVSTGALLHTLDNPNPDGTSQSDEFGKSVAISDNYAIVGATGENDAGTNSGKVYIFNNSTGALVHTLSNPNAYGTSQDDYFGTSVAISGNYAILGTPYEDYAGGTNSGKAYIYDVTTGALVHTLDNPNAYGTSADDSFGGSVAISGNYAIVGARNEDDASGTDSGKAYIFDVTTGALLRTINDPNAYGTSAADQFGNAVAISGDYAIVGAFFEADAGGNGSGKAYIFNVSTGALLHTLNNPNAYGTSANDQFGYSVAMSGDYAIVGAYREDDAGGNDSGKAYIFNVSTGALLHTLDNPNAYGTSAGDFFGWSVAMSDSHVIVGARNEGDAGGTYSGKSYIYEIEQEPGNEIEAPGAPTIGTATVVNTSTVAVQFTAPAEDGYATIETYTATSSPGGITGTLSQEGSGTITVTGLYTENTSYTFTVTATNSYTTGNPSSASNSVVPVPPPPDWSNVSLSQTLNNPNAYGTSQSDYFGYSAAISGNYAIVGVPNESDASGTSSGKAYIFDVTTGALLRTINNPNPYSSSASDNFGTSVGISGNYAIVGAHFEDAPGANASGKAYIYNVSTGALVHTLDNPNASDWDQFGTSVAISGNYALVGASGENKAYIFDVTTGALLRTIDNPNAYGASASDYFGVSAAISGNYAIVGAYLEGDAGGTYSGKAYIFDVTTGALVHTLDNPNAYGTSANDRFGYRVAISDTYAIVGAHYEDDAEGTPPAGGEDSGKAYIFNVSTGALVRTLDNPNPYGASWDEKFGYAVAISGNAAIVGAMDEDHPGGFDSGKAYIFDVTTGALLRTINDPNAYGTPANDRFGSSVAISGNYAIVGAIGESEAGRTSSGKAYIYYAA